MSKDKFFLIPTIVSLLSAIFIMVFLTLFYHILPTQLPLFYSLSWGEDQLAQKNQFFILPALIILITLINTALAWQIPKDQLIFKRILFLTNAITSFIIIITGLKILTIFI